MTVEGKDTPDPKLTKSITDILSVKTVLFGAAYSECPWDFSAHATSGAVLGVYDGNVNPQHLVSVSICERTDDVHVDQKKCLYKTFTSSIGASNPTTCSGSRLSVEAGNARHGSNHDES